MTAKNSQFNHLKIHTQYSICEGALKISDLSEYCKAHKITSIGISDSRNMCGVLEFSEEISKAGTQPIIGTQINFSFSHNNLEKIGKISLIAKNIAGYKNLLNLSSHSLRHRGIGQIFRWSNCFAWRITLFNFRHDSQQQYFRM
jgi:DNA polymerase III subunit alpha